MNVSEKMYSEPADNARKKTWQGFGPMRKGRISRPVAKVKWQHYSTAYNGQHSNAAAIFARKMQSGPPRLVLGMRDQRHGYDCTTVATSIPAKPLAGSLWPVASLRLKYGSSISQCPLLSADTLESNI